MWRSSYRRVLQLSVLLVLIIIEITPCKGKRTKNEKTVSVLIQDIYPYGPFRNKKGKELTASKKSGDKPPIHKRPIRKILKETLVKCYKEDVKLEIKKQNDKGWLTTDVVLPVVMEWQDLLVAKDGLLDTEYTYIPVLESPGAVILVANDDTPRYVLLEVMTQCWPLALVVLSSAPLAGIIMWILDHARNSKDFPKRFLHGGWEGVWWAFVTMTTVGYGDRSPRSVQGRLCGLLWMFVGITLMSIFTATLTTAITADQSETAEIKESKMGVFNGSREEILAIKERAAVEVYTNVGTMLDSLQTGEIDGILVDSLYAHYLGCPLKHLKEAAYIRSSAFFGIVLQNQTVEIQHCFAREVSKKKTWLYSYMSNEYQRKSAKKIYRRKVEESASTVCKGLVRVCIACTVVSLVLIVCCSVWQCIQQRLIRKKLSPVEEFRPNKIAFVPESPSATFNPRDVTKH